MERVPAAAPAAESSVPFAATLALPVPENLIDFMQMYGIDAACREALARARWPGGFCCPRCGHSRSYRLAERIEVECAGCGYQVSPTAGTLLHGTKPELHKLFLLL